MEPRPPVLASPLCASASARTAGYGEEYNRMKLNRGVPRYATVRVEYASINHRSSLYQAVHCTVVTLC